LSRVLRNGGFNPQIVAKNNVNTDDKRLSLSEFPESFCVFIQERRGNLSTAGHHANHVQKILAQDFLQVVFLISTA
jgi:hypothetical protein